MEVDVGCAEVGSLAEAATKGRDCLHMTTIRARDRLIVALDFPLDSINPDRTLRVDDVDQLVNELGDLIDIVKVGWALFLATGTEVIERLRYLGKDVFLDLKFGDISEQIRRLVAVAVEQGVRFTTVNASIQALRAGVEARGASDLKILTVTLLTSLDETDLAETGYTGTVDDYVRKKAQAGRMAECDGIVASGREAAMIRELIPDRNFLIVTPGIRPSGGDVDDHKRAVTPTEAIRAGADYLVVGRPITKARSPRDATERVLQEMQTAFDSYR